MATAHVYPFDTVKSGRSYDSDPHYRSPVTAPGAVTLDERPGDYLENRPGIWLTPPVTKDRYPAPRRADLVTLWKRDNHPVLSITAGGKVHDFHLPPARLAVLLREVADLLAESTVLK